MEDLTDCQYHHTYNVCTLRRVWSEVSLIYTDLLHLQCSHQVCLVLHKTSVHKHRARILRRLNLPPRLHIWSLVCSPAHYLSSQADNKQSYSADVRTLRSQKILSNLQPPLPSLQHCLQRSAKYRLLSYFSILSWLCRRCAVDGWCWINCRSDGS